jgi:adenine phosphoribosyltransferase
MTPSAADLVGELTRSGPDFPQAGIMFRDLTPVFADGAALRSVTQALVEPFRGRVDAIAGVEARGFLLSATAAYELGLGTLLVRKPGKLPGTVLSRSYDLEYGSATLEVQPADLPPGTRVLLVDDVLATGGTLAASAELIEAAGWTVVGISVVMELEALDGRGKLHNRELHTIVKV